MGIFSAIKQGFDIADALQEFMDMAGASFDLALDMCGTEGQMAIIEGMGDEVFMNAAMGAFSGDDPEGILVGACSHPEAVGEILSEAASMIDEAASDLREALGEDD
jgi:hypothetical protein